MSIKHIQSEIPDNNPFENCKLERKKYADILTNIINSYPDGFVLAINNKWGTGKTTFVKMWEQDLKNQNFQTVYFNAWENDFENNPLIALMGELKALTTKSTEPVFKSTLKKAATLTKHLAPIVVKSIADRYINTENVKDAIDGITKGVSEIFENEVNEYSKRKKNISEFRSSLGKFIESRENNKSLIFIIDELDRCRPDYAVSILEQIKHFFSIPNITFILSIDKIQLGNAIRGVYGSDRIDADEYLRRFIDLEYSIPEPDPKFFNRYLYDYYKFDDFFASPERIKYGELRYDKSDFLKIAEIIFSTSNVSLREQEKIFALCRISLRSFGENYYVFPFVYLFLIFIKFKRIDFYDALKSYRLSIQNVQEFMFEIVASKTNSKDEYQLIALEAYLLHYYSNSLNLGRQNKIILYEADTNMPSQNKLLIDSIINKDKNIDMLRVLESLESRRNGGDLELNYFINKIELLEELLF